ncbi:SCO2400 family protein [Streptomyces wuyuanensis]|uniref:SCO2400 family protein n=1 Tax=Streptomyces wuyuanensis TaxID=1196353 RepID=UPI003D72FE99
MDYCHQCRRHLNGALACAGCGTPAEELRHFRPATAAAESDVVVELGGAYGDEGRAPAGRRRAGTQGRRARKAAGTRRARRKRGRKVLIGALGLALAAGVLSLAELARESSGGGDDTSVEVREQESLAVDDVPEPTGSAEPPPGPSAVSEPPTTSSATVRPTGAVGRGSPRPTVEASEPQEGPTESAPAESGPRDDDAPSPTGDPSQQPSQSPSSPPPAPPAEPSPSPTPTRDCWLIFWCS